MKHWPVRKTSIWIRGGGNKLHKDGKKKESYDFNSKKKNAFCFLHGIHNFDFLSFVNFHLDQIWGVEKYLQKYEKMSNSTYVVKLAA